MTDQTPAPQAPEVTIGDVARGFLADLDAHEDPHQVPAEAPEEPIQQPEDEPQIEEAETPPPETPVIEYELEDGSKIQVPENLKPHLMRDKDYRQKTMAIAEQKKQYDHLTAQVQQQFAQAQQMAPLHAQLFAMDARANQLTQILQSGQLNDDPVQYNRVQGDLALLLRNRDQFAGNLSQQAAQFQSQEAQIRRQKLAMEAPQLFEKFPDLQKPEAQRELTEYVRAEGLSDFEVEYLSFSAAGVKLAWKAKQYDRMVKDQSSHRAKLNEKVKTLPPATQSSRAADKGANTKQLQDSWQKRGGKINDPAFGQLLRDKLRKP